jgi:3-oxoacyl-[acyl-carrier protein] reductase
MNQNNFENQIVVVTGGTRGIGGGLSEAFLKHGATVIATYAKNDEKALAFKSSLGALGEKLELRKFDVRNTESIKAFYHDLREKYKRLDVLINNSGIREDALLATMTDEQWENVIQTNLTGTFKMTKEAVMLMLENRYGRIINISSVGGKLGLPGQANYAASKAGQVALSLSLAKEVAKRGITINNVLPGFIETDLIADLPEEQKKEYKSQVPMKRFGKVEEVASAVLFLASKEASYITAASLEIAGGL